jgi:leucyl aminopeptidase (aminopeptidase T)
VELEKAAKTIVNDLMGVKRDETVLVIVDEKSEQIGEVLWEAAKAAEAEALLVKMSERETHGAEPPRQIADMMMEVDVVLAPTTKSLTHTKARREASEAGVRVASMPSITADMMARTMSADYAQIKVQTEKLADILTNGEDVHITAPSGTDLHLSLEDRDGEADFGLLDERGASGNLPAGEAYVAPLEGTSNGVVVIDGSISGIGKLESPLRITVRNGYAEDVQGAQAEELVDLFDKHGRKARNVAEFGIGTNPKAIITGNVLEDEKVMGTIHIAFGNNMSMGGTVNVPQHLDGIVKNPTVTVDGKQIMKDGEFTI